MKASPEQQLRLLDLQEVDATLDRLVSRRKSLPEHAVIEACDERLREIDDQLVAAETVVADIGREQRKLEADVDQVRARADKDTARLQSGAVSHPKELESLQSEIDSLARRQGVLEDEVLEIMERFEAAATVVSDLQKQKAETEAERSAAAERRDAAIKDIDFETGMRTTEREVVQPGVPAELLALYDKIRAATPGGIAAAALTRRQCTGCHLDLAGSDLVAAKNAAADDVLRCEECRRILVRTAESGL